MPSGLPRRIGSSGWLMHAAARQSYYNRGSKANWEAIKADRDRVNENVTNIVLFLSALIGFPILGILALGFSLLYGPIVWVTFAAIALTITGLIKGL
jgi:hypothetical protein